MAKNQTSFIPKGSSAGSSGGGHYAGGNWLMLIGFIVFLIVFAGMAGVFFYKQQALKKQAKVEDNLVQAKDAFEPGSIEIVDAFAAKVDAAKTLVNEHIALTPVFSLVEQLTLKSVQFSAMDITVMSEQSAGSESSANAADSATASVKLEGTAPDNATVALQSSKIADHENVINTVLSDFSPNESGDIEFTMQFTVPISELRYVNTI